MTPYEKKVLDYLMNTFGKKVFDYKVIERQPLLVRLILIPVVRTSDRPMQILWRWVARLYYAVFTLGFLELLIRRILGRLFPNQ